MEVTSIGVDNRPPPSRGCGILISSIMPAGFSISEKTRARKNYRYPVTEPQESTATWKKKKRFSNFTDATGTGAGDAVHPTVNTNIINSPFNFYSPRP